MRRYFGTLLTPGIETLPPAIRTNGWYFLLAVQVGWPPVLWNVVPTLPRQNVERGWALITVAGHLPADIWYAAATLIASSAFACTFLPVAVP